MNVPLSLAAALLAAASAPAPPTARPTAQSPAPSVDARIDEALASGARALTLDGGELGGAGAELLLGEARRTSFLALGESHLNEETPALTAALLEALAPAGYSVLAIETGEAIAEHARAKLAIGRRDELAALFAELPFTAAFLDHAPELDLLQRAVGLGYDLWGLDQVFAGGARFNLRRLVELAPDAAALTAATAASERAGEAFLRFASTGDTSAGFLQSVTEEELAELRLAFAGVLEAERIVDELVASSRIYQLYRSGANYESNRERIALMKRHLIENLRRAPSDARVVLKFGSVHMRRGYSPVNQLDLGNAVAELGLLRGGGSLHVQVTALGSVGTDGELTDWTAQAPHLARFAAAMPEDASWAVFDLRPLRPIFHDERNEIGREALASAAWGYDLLVLARRFHRASRLPGVPGPPGD